jgi:hypothetical protein
MSRSIHDIEQEIGVLCKDEADLRKEKSHWMNLLLTDPSVRQSIDTVNGLMRDVFHAQERKWEEIKVLREKGMLLI